MNEELDKPGWSGAELAAQTKGDAKKIRIAQRLRAVTAATLKWTHVSNLFRHASQTINENQNELNLCQ